MLILIVLFTTQRSAPRKSDALRPIMLVCSCDCSAGVSAIVQHPEVLAALDPSHRAFHDARGRPWAARARRVFLCITGGEALYAILGHFGRDPFDCPGTPSLPACC